LPLLKFQPSYIHVKGLAPTHTSFKIRLCYGPFKIVVILSRVVHFVAENNLEFSK